MTTRYSYGGDDGSAAGGMPIDDGGTYDGMPVGGADTGIYIANAQMGFDVPASQKPTPFWQCSISISAGPHTVKLGYRLNGQKLIATVSCATCQGWLALGIARDSAQMVGATAVIGWLDGWASPHFVGKYALDGKDLSQMRLMPHEQQTLQDAEIRRVDGVLTMSPPPPSATRFGGSMSYVHLLAAAGAYDRFPTMATRAALSPPTCWLHDHGHAAAAAAAQPPAAMPMAPPPPPPSSPPEAPPPPTAPAPKLCGPRRRRASTARTTAWC